MHQVLARQGSSASCLDAQRGFKEVHLLRAHAQGLARQVFGANFLNAQGGFQGVRQIQALALALASRGASGLITILVKTCPRRMLGLVGAAENRRVESLDSMLQKGALTWGVERLGNLGRNQDLVGEWLGVRGKGASRELRGASRGLQGSFEGASREMACLSGKGASREVGVWKGMGSD